jgi:Fur-regulated basic protein B
VEPHKIFLNVIKNQKFVHNTYHKAITEREECIMRRPRKKSFSDLVKENKRQLMMDQEALDAIEERIDARLEIKRIDKAE